MVNSDEIMSVVTIRYTYSLTQIVFTSKNKSGGYKSVSG